MIRNGPTAASNLPAAVMDYDEVADWLPEDVDALSLHPLAYAPDVNGSAVPIVSAAEFARFTAARHHNDLNGLWFGEVTTEGDRMLYAATEYVESYGGPETFPLDPATGGYRIDGWALIRLTDALAAA